MDSKVKQVRSEPNGKEPVFRPPIVIANDGSRDDTSSSSASSDVDGFFVAQIQSQERQKRNSSDFDDSNLPVKKHMAMASDFGLTSEFNSPNAAAGNITVLEAVPVSVVMPVDFSDCNGPKQTRVTRQFWKAGDYEGDTNNSDSTAGSTVGIDHVRVHPKFLHSNATSHKWALGAVAELLYNSLDEVCNGATYVHVDMTKNRKDGSYMLIVEDNGGGMNPDKIRQCMSLGYSVKSKMANTIGQYGNGFKTSTMRLGADAIVFSCSQGTNGKSPTQSIGMLSYTFLRGTRKEDIVVPMIDFEKRGGSWDKIIRSSVDDWNRNLETIVHWSPYTSERDLLQQFNFLSYQGTRIVIYNLWEDDEGKLELDFDMDPYDIQLRGVNRDEKHIEMAQRYPNCKHFFTYRHSLRSYASILYLKLPQNFKIILRGKEVEHHNLVNDMMLVEERKYKPMNVAEGTVNQDIVATVKLGFVRDAYHHVDIQGFNVYHKNRLIKPFWRVWNAAGSDGRAVIGVLEANFVEPAHDKQGFERTTVLSRLEARLVKFQKRYWSSKCQEVGYAPRRNLKSSDFSGKDSNACAKMKPVSCSNENGRASKVGASKIEEAIQYKKRSLVDVQMEDKNNDKVSLASFEPEQASCGRIKATFRCPNLKGTSTDVVEKVRADSDLESLVKLKKENQDLRKRLNDAGASDMLEELQNERERRQSLEFQLHEARAKLEELDRENLALLDIFQEEKGRHDETEEALREKLREASHTIDGLLERVRQLEERVAQKRCFKLQK